MDNFQLESFFKKCPITSKFFLGINSSDKIGQFLDILKNKEKGFIIINTLLSDSNLKEIGHWVLIGKFKKNIIFFDSLGKKPQYYNSYIKNFLSSFQRNKLVLANFTIQASKSCTCPIYCIFYSYYLCLGVNFQSLNRIFSKNNRTANDKKIFGWFNKKFNKISAGKILHCK